MRIAEMGLLAAVLSFGAVLPQRERLPYPADANQQGFRMQGEVPVRKRVPVRIICLGDSHTYGWNVRAEDAYPSILQDRLNAATGSLRFQVINAGLGGICMIEKERIYRENCRFLQHDWVILQVGMDLPRIAMHIRNDRRESGVLWRAAQRLHEVFPMSRWTQRFWEIALRKENIWLEGQLLKEGQEPLFAEARQVFIAQLNRLYAEVRSSDARLLIVEYDSGGYHAAIRDCVAGSRANVAPLVHVRPEIFDIHRHFLPDMHLNHEGYKIMVREIMSEFGAPLLGARAALAR